MNAERYVKICSKCGSEDVHTDFSNPVVWAYGTRSNYRCENCQYVGDLFPEVSEASRQYTIRKIKSKHNEPKDEELIDNVPGLFAGIWQGLLGIIALFISIAVLLDGSLLVAPALQLIFVIGILYLVWRVLKHREDST